MPCTMVRGLIVGCYAGMDGRRVSGQAVCPHDKAVCWHGCILYIYAHDSSPGCALCMYLNSYRDGALSLTDT